VRINSIIITGLIILLIGLSACTSNQSNIPDESSVSNEKQTQIANPASAFCESQGGKLTIQTDETGNQYGLCTLADGTQCEEWAHFKGECPENNPNNIPEDIFIPNPEVEPNQKRIYCTDKQKEAVVCTMEYNPVCGYFYDSIQCIKAPCAQTFGNGCSACADEKVEYYKTGECPI
jgi:putative hemolysin